MELKEVIYARKSTRKFDMEELDKSTLNKVISYAHNLKRTHLDIKTEVVLLDPSEVMSIMTWKAPHYYAIFSEEKEGYLTNAGFMFQQLDLFIQSQGLGCCWLGLARTNKVIKGKKCVIMLAFGKPAEGESNLRQLEEFNRKPMNQICDFFDEKIEPARLAPSSMNSQPWFFIHDDYKYHVYCQNPGIIKGIALKNFNKIDIGITLAHIYVTNPIGFYYYEIENPKPLNKYYYVGTFTI